MRNTYTYSNFQTQVISGMLKLIIAGIGILLSLSLNIILILLKGILTLGHRVLRR